MLAFKSENKIPQSKLAREINHTTKLWNRLRDLVSLNRVDEPSRVTPDLNLKPPHPHAPAGDWF